MPSTRHPSLCASILIALAGGLLAFAPPLNAQEQPESPDARAKREQYEREQGMDPVKRKEAEAAAAAAASGRIKAQPVTPSGQAVANPKAPNPSAAQGSASGSARGPAKGLGVTVSGGAANGQPGAGHGGQALKADEVSLVAYSEGIDLKVLIEYVADTLQINVVAADDLQGTVVLNAPVVVKRSELLTLLDALLEQHGYTIILDAQSGFYKILKLDNVTVTFDTERATTRIIATPTIRPSSLSDVISQHMGMVVAAGGQGRSRINYLDDLSVIVVTDSPRRIDTIQQLVNTIMARANDQIFIRFDLEHLAASSARNRVLELVGRSSSTGLPQGNAPGQPLTALAGGNFDNLADRLTADAQGNALILRGYPEEEAKIRTLLAVLDKPNGMEYKQYFAGSAALQIAQLAERFGFGTVETVETTAAQNQAAGIQPGALRANQPGLNLLQGNQAATLGGPVLVVDPSRGAITYNGTASQQGAIQKLIASFNPQLEVVEFRAYKIKNMPASDMADLLQGLIFNEEVSRSDGNSFLPGSNRRSSRSNYQDRNSGGSRLNRNNSNPGGNDFQNQGTRGNTGRTNSNQNRGSFSVGGRPGGALAVNPGGEASPDGVAAVGGQDVFLLADEANNQVVVKATSRDHTQIAKLIDKLDQRRPQVNIEVQIVSVSATDDFRLAFEVQGVFDRGRDGALNTNFGLGTFAGTTTGTTTSNGNFVGPKSVVTSLAGLTAAVVRSDHVPIIMTALKRNADTRILSSPQLLVDDNEYAEIVSLDEQPTTGTDIGTSTSTTSFTGYESAGTSLSVTPSISEGGYLRLEYEIELSNFVGTSTNGVPAPKQTRNVSSSNVTIPGNATIIVGGIKVDSDGKTIVKVPLLGDIPILGKLFSDTNKNRTTTRLYVFITPRIMRDINGGDVSLLTRGHAADAGVEVDGPKLKPVMMEFNEAPKPILPASAVPSDPVPPTAAKREESGEGAQR